MPQLTSTGAQYSQDFARNVFRTLNEAIGPSSLDDALSRFLGEQRKQRWNDTSTNFLADQFTAPENAMNLGMPIAGMTSNKIAGYLDDPFNKFRYMSDDAVESLAVKLQKRLDDAIDGLVAKGIPMNKAVKHESLAPMENAVEAITQYQYEKSYNELLNKVSGLVQNRPTAENILSDAYSMQKPTNPTARYFASEYTTQDVGERDRTINKIFNVLRQNWEDTTHLNYEGVMGPNSGLTELGQKELKDKFMNRTNAIEKSVYEYFNRP